MHRGLVSVLALLALAVHFVAAQELLHEHRIAAGDLELGGELRGLPPGSTRYVSYEDLLRLPQQTFTVSDDSNFSGKTQVAGVFLETLAHMFGAVENSDSLIVAICYDKYRANYPSGYVSAHHPLLVLRINGERRDKWPKSEHGESMGPYVISHPLFKPSFRVLSHQDEAQVPYGVTRLELRRESRVFGAIRPPGSWQPGSPVLDGYAIARQDCFRCHNMGAEGGRLAGRSWFQLAKVASEDGESFRRTLAGSQAGNSAAKAHQQFAYDDETLNALMAYFRTFAGKRRAH